jgi:hypothetical protein
MPNSVEKAVHWINFLAEVPEVPFADRLKAHFDAGKITRLCDCGCNSFDLKIDTDVVLPPLTEVTGRSGKFFEIAFASDGGAEMAFLFFVDERGYLSGIDVTRGAANHGPVPDLLTVGKLLYIN